MDHPRRRRAAIVAIASVVAATCIALGFWQLQRLADRRDLNAMILVRRSTTPVTIAGASTHAGSYRSAIAEGTYDIEHEVLVYGRSLDGEAGHHVLTPLVLDGGDAILVVRGWVPFAMRSAPVADAAPPPGLVRARGVLVPDEGDGSTTPDANGVVRAIDVTGIASALPYDVAPLPLQLVEQTPPHPGDLPRPVPLPELSEGSHLSYAIQWFTFATIAAVGAVILLRRERRELTGGP